MEDKRYTIGCVTSSVSYQGGWDTLSKGIIGAVAKKHTVITLTSRHAKNDRVPYAVHTVLPDTCVSFSLLNQLWICIASLVYLRKCDALHVFIEPFAPGVAFAAFLMRKPLCITIAGTYCVIPKGKSLRERVKRVLMRFMYRYASSVVTGSNRNIELIEEVQNLHGKWKFIPFGVDPEKYVGKMVYPKPPHPFIFTVGEVKARKGALYTVRALGELKNEIPELHYKIAGSYTESVYLEEVRTAIREYSLEDRVEFLGRVPDAELVELYATCSVFVLAAQTVNGSFEGFPMVFYEAHSLGAPVVSTYGFGSEYVIKNGYNGYLVPQNDHKELATAIKKIVTDPVLRNTMSENGRKEAHAHSWDAIAVEYLRTYDDMLNKK